jgi:hypothetical protein
MYHAGNAWNASNNVTHFFNCQIARHNDASPADVQKIALYTNAFTTVVDLSLCITALDRVSTQYALHQAQSAGRQRSCAGRQSKSTGFQLILIPTA